MVKDKLFSELKLVPDNLLFIYVEGNWEAIERFEMFATDFQMLHWCDLMCKARRIKT